MQAAAIKCEDEIFGETDSPMERVTQALDSDFKCNVNGYLGNAMLCIIKMLFKKATFDTEKGLIGLLLPFTSSDLAYNFST